MKKKEISYFISSNLTLTNLLTPDSCIVIPYNKSTYSIVFFLCVININCVLFLSPFIYCPKLSTLTSSKAASTSSNIQKGTGLDLSIANNKLIAVNVFSPPDKREILVNFLPGGDATISIPVSSKSDFYLQPFHVLL